MRFRAHLFGKPLGPWLPTAELAKQSAIEEGEGHRDPGSGIVYLSPGVTIERDEGEEPMPPHLEKWAVALDMIAEHHNRVEEYIGHQISAAGEDAERRAKWRLIQKRVAELMSAAAKDARSSVAARPG